jgi:hypothetical protein
MMTACTAQQSRSTARVPHRLARKRETNKPNSGQRCGHCDPAREISVCDDSLPRRLGKPQQR